MMMRFTTAGRLAPALLTAGLVLGAVQLAGCSSTGDARTLDYETSTTLPPLEVPPDLSALDVDDSYAMPAGGGRVSAARVDQGGDQVESRSGVLPRYDDIVVKRAGQLRWLEAKASPEQLWPKLRDFLGQQGLEIEQEQPRLGIIETAWAENRAGLTRSGLRKYLGKLYDAGLRDRYRLRLEREEGGVTAVYLTHRGAREVVADEDIIKWELRPSDPELEAEMLRRLMVFLGMEEEAAEKALESPRDQTITMRLAERDGRPTLTVEDSFVRSWRRIGIALDRIALLVQDQNRAGGTYYVVYKGDERYERGFLKGLFGDGEKDLLSVNTVYQLQVLDQGSYVEVTAYDEEGAALSDEIGGEILSRLQEALK
ncbi:MAG: outer membrane protein assembly factor BamC [Gammaproteobacteria bacterium]|nr:outer membrane protein assembly factor BamC [Gammaproteobacteria bacterium]MDX5375053.1 outer membrane protein assembly factor BamC [Gammaproteobacteria bacterium]